MSDQPHAHPEVFRVGVIDYVNSLAFFLGELDDGMAWVREAPRASGLALANGALDAALVPVRHAVALEEAGVVRRLGALGIAIDGGAASVLLEGPADLADLRGGFLRATGASSSSVALSRILLEGPLGAGTVPLVRDGEPAPPGLTERGRLIIGDAALALAAAPRDDAGDATLHDLGMLWKQWTGLPFVFARWVVRRDADAATASRLEARLRAAAKAHGPDTRGRVPDAIVDEACARMPLTRDAMAAYLARFRYVLGPGEEAGEARFLAACDERAQRAAFRADGDHDAGPSFWRDPARTRALPERPELTMVASAAPSFLREIRRKVASGERLNEADGTFLLAEAPLAALTDLADQARFARVPRPEVTFIVDSNPNYSNVCDAYCSFCAFYRPPKAKRNEGAYRHATDDLLERFRAHADKGVTTILLQGGHHPELPLEYYTELVSRVRSELDGVTPHFFSAGEIRKMAEVSGRGIPGVLEALWAAGQRSLPGGGAEILSARVREAISPLKGPPEWWFEVHREAHGVGMRSTATMMFGHLEAASDLIAHLLAVRALQDETGGFTAFVPWSFKPGDTPLGRKVDRFAGAMTYLRVLATARLVLDNVDHVQGSFFSEGWDAGALSLRAGADDVGGLLLEENVHREAGHTNPTPLDEVVRRIHEAGFDAVQRDTLYQHLRRFPRAAAA